MLHNGGAYGGGGFGQYNVTATVTLMRDRNLGPSSIIKQVGCNCQSHLATWTHRCPVVLFVYSQRLHKT